MGKWFWSNTSDKNTFDNNNFSFIYSFKDLQNNIAFSLSGVKLEIDRVTDTMKFTVGSMKFISSDYSVATTKFTKILSASEGDSYNIGQGSTEVDFATISNDVRRLAAYLLEDNTISITATSGFEIDAGGGNDTVTGGIGNDIITGGIGNDIITGGLGNDSIIAGAGRNFCGSDRAVDKKIRH